MGTGRSRMGVNTITSVLLNIHSWERNPLAMLPTEAADPLKAILSVSYSKHHNTIEGV